MRINNDVLDRLDAVEFPAPPILVGRLSQLLNQESANVEALSAAIELDATLALRLLRLANSVVLGGNGEVETVQDAVMRVGVESIRDVVYALSLVGTLRPASFAYRPFWRHSLAVAHAARLLKEQLPAGKSAPLADVYTAGLLHDIGMLVFDRAIGTRYGAVLAQARHERRPLCLVEQTKLGLDHAEAGGRILATWELPGRLVAAARLHHQSPAEAEREVLLVHLADLVCNHIGIHHGTGFLPQDLVDQAWADLGIDGAVFPAVAVDVRRAIERADRFLAAI